MGDNQEKNNANADKLVPDRIAARACPLPPRPADHVRSVVRPSPLLLESAKIDKKHALDSMLLVDSALRINALGQTIMLQALSANGAALLPLLDARLTRRGHDRRFIPTAVN